PASCAVPLALRRTQPLSAAITLVFTAGGGSLIPKATAVSTVKPPPVPITVKLKFAGTAKFEAVNVRMEVPGALTTGGLKLPVTLGGNRATVRPTLAVKPLLGVMTTWQVALVPGSTLTAGGSTARSKEDDTRFR